MSQNQTTRYFKYAIGEILLVVIGILLALQINNWNEVRINQSKLKSYILAYKLELEYNIQLFDREIRAANHFIDKNIRTLEIRDFDSIHVDSLEQMIETFYINFDTENYVHETFKNSQITDFGKYDSIINNMQFYYAWTYTEIDDVLKQHNSAVDKADEFWRFEQNAYELNYNSPKSTTLQSEEERKRNMVELIKSPRGRNILKIDIRKKREVIDYIKNYKAVSVQNLQQINRILNLN